MGTKPKRAPERYAAVGDTRPLAGSQDVLTREMLDYVVTLKERPDAAEPVSRRDLVERGVARNSAFINKLQRFLADQGLSEEVAFGKPLAFSIVTLTCTPRVAKLIESLPEVDSVSRDSQDLQFIR